MGIGKRVKNLFWRSSDDDEEETPEVATGDGDGEDEDFDEDFAEMLGDDPHFVAAADADPVASESFSVQADAGGGV